MAAVLSECVGQEGKVTTIDPDVERLALTQQKVMSGVLAKYNIM